MGWIICVDTVITKNYNRTSGITEKTMCQQLKDEKNEGEGLKAEEHYSKEQCYYGTS